MAVIAVYEREVKTSFIVDEFDILSDNDATS